MIVFGVPEKISNPREYFLKNHSELIAVSEAICEGFGRELEPEDIFSHVTSPEHVFLIRDPNKIVGMASYNKIQIESENVLVVEGISLKPTFQSKGIFKKITDLAIEDETLIALRTQSPRMYAALYDYCNGAISPSENFNGQLEKIAKHFGNEINREGVTRGYYGRFFYGYSPSHERFSELFEKMLDVEKGDALIVLGRKK